MQFSCGPDVTRWGEKHSQVVERSLEAVRKGYWNAGEQDDPILSVVNIIDVLLVIIAVLAIMVVRDPLHPLSADDVVVVTNPGKENMSITYRMDDGSLVYLPEGS